MRHAEQVTHGISFADDGGCVSLILQFRRVYRCFFFATRIVGPRPRVRRRPFRIAIFAVAEGVLPCAIFSLDFARSLQHYRKIGGILSSSDSTPWRCQTRARSDFPLFERTFNGNDKGWRRRWRRVKQLRRWKSKQWYLFFPWTVVAFLK